MFDLGWGEILLVGVVALIVVGPKDLPRMFKSIGQVVGRMRGMAREFQRAMDSAANETGVKDLSTGIKAATSPKQLGLDKFNELAERVTDGLNIPDNKIMSTALNKPPPKKKPLHQKEQSQTVASSKINEDTENTGKERIHAGDPEPTTSDDEREEVELTAGPSGGETSNHENQNLSVH